MRSMIQGACVTLILLQVPTYFFMSSGVKIGRITDAAIYVNISK